ncbi:MAG: hypothetical protein ACREPR_15120 [Brasilonema sp.]
MRKSVLFPSNSLQPSTSLGTIQPTQRIGSIPFWRIARRLEVWGYTYEVRLRGLSETRVGGFSLYSRDFQSPGVSSKSGCSQRIEQENNHDK